MEHFKRTQEPTWKSFKSAKVEQISAKRERTELYLKEFFKNSDFHTTINGWLNK